MSLLKFKHNNQTWGIVRNQKCASTSILSYIAQALWDADPHELQAYNTFRVHAPGQREGEELPFLSRRPGPRLPGQHRHGPALDGPREDGIQKRGKKGLCRDRRPTGQEKNEVQQAPELLAR